MPGSNQPAVRIEAIREIAAPMRGEIRNAYIDFTKMTATVVAVVIYQVSRVSFHDAWNDAVAQNAIGSVATIGVEAVADNALAVTDDIGDHGNN